MIHRATSLLILLGLCLGLASAAAAQGQAVTEDAADRKAVLITGASSGIGLRTTELLAENGFHVYAGARKPKDLEALSAMENVEGIRLDVTVQEEIDAAVKHIEEAGRGLYAVINNAGVVVVAPLIEVTEEDMDFQMDVNVFGPYRVTKACAPLLIESKGRVLTTGSISGFVTWGLGGPYTMSKHAVEAYTDVLAAELVPFGIGVSVVEPGNYKSRIMANMVERMEDSGYSAEDSLYKGQMDWLTKGATDRAQYKEPDEVAEAFLEALNDPKPKRRYMVVPNEQEARLTLNAALQKVVQLNEDQAYTFDRGQLIEMLDAALAQARE
ncbi:MAG: SDR family oxidoreductase [Planctomycetota bacterium]|jgi:NAD(P)-dependent dehydrogenase (short-subunit alcohol dehydrogenase family)